MKASEIAYKAAKIMSERGHCKDRLEDENGAVCHQGALLLAFHPRERLIPEGRTLYGWDLTEEEKARLDEINATGARILEAMGDNNHLGVVSFNNNLRTSGEDVILLLKESGRILEEEDAEFHRGQEAVLLRSRQG